MAPPPDNPSPGILTKSSGIGNQEFIMRTNRFDNDVGRFLRYSGIVRQAAVASPPGVMAEDRGKGTRNGPRHVTVRRVPKQPSAVWRHKPEARAKILRLRFRLVSR